MRMNKMEIPEIIAEVGVNYYDVSAKLSISLIDAAKQMVLECKMAGIRIVKFQTYKSGKLAAEHSPAYWDLNEEPTTSQKELFSKFDKLKKEDYEQIAEYCKKLGIEFLSTAFDFESANFINNIVSTHKIASADITNFPYLEKIGQYGKPVILSTGASEIEEIVQAVDLLKNNGCTDITLLHCVLAYPTQFEDVNLWKIKSLKKNFPDCRIGVSDHTMFNIDVLTTAWLLGATIIEKHFTLDKTLKGNDHYHAGDPEDFKQLLNKIQFVKSVHGEEKVNWSLDCEKDARKNARRGVYLIRDVERDERIKIEDVEILRPQLDGISPKELISCFERNIAFHSSLRKGTLVKKSHLT